jgi:hypothetical protein
VRARYLRQIPHSSAEFADVEGGLSARRVRANHVSCCSKHASFDVTNTESVTHAEQKQGACAHTSMLFQTPRYQVTEH